MGLHQGSSDLGARCRTQSTRAESRRGRILALAGCLALGYWFVIVNAGKVGAEVPNSEVTAAGPAVASDKVLSEVVQGIKAAQSKHLGSTSRPHLRRQVSVVGHSSPRAAMAGASWNEAGALCRGPNACVAVSRPRGARRLPGASPGFHARLQIMASRSANRRVSGGHAASDVIDQLDFVLQCRVDTADPVALDKEALAPAGSRRSGAEAAGVGDDVESTVRRDD